MDTTDPEIQFSADGTCNHCASALARMKRQLLPSDERALALSKLVGVIKQDGRKREYDCIIGVSGGVDSTMTAYHVKRLGLRPLAVHFDNGWNSELAVDNIKTTLDWLKIDLYTYVVEWEEFRDLLRSFMMSSVANCEVPTDHGIAATLFRAARRHGLRYILSGSNLVTEAIMPRAWGHDHQDLRHLKAIHRQFGTVPMRTMPTTSVLQYVYYVLWKKVRQIPFLNYIDYDKQESQDMLAKEVGWRDYGGKYYESVWTRFFQGYYLVEKFGYDKRRAHLSSLICAGQMQRDEAVRELEKPVYEATLLRQDIAFVIKKLGLTETQFKEIMQDPPKSVADYPSNYFLFHQLRRFKDLFRDIATSP